MKAEIKPLTGIRGVAAFLVMLYHYGTYPAFADLHWSMLFRRGYLCVDLFFVLSGFVLALRYGNRFEVNPTWTTYSAFLRARVARLYPAYVFIIFVYYAKWIINISGTNTAPFSFQDWIANLLFVQSWGLPVHIIVGDSWSVSVEFIAYLLLPLLLVPALQQGTKSAVALAVIAVIALFAIANTGYGVSGPLDDVQVFAPLRCVAEFSLGLLAFRVTQMSAAEKVLSSEMMPGLALLLVGTALIVDRTDVVIVLTLTILVATLSYAKKSSAVLFGNGLLHHLGEISYSFYLLHPFFMTIAGHYKAMAEFHHGLFISYLFVSLGITATWFAAFLSYRFIEVPGRHLLAGSRGAKVYPSTIFAAVPMVGRMKSDAE